MGRQWPTVCCACGKVCEVDNGAKLTCSAAAIAETPAKKNASMRYALPLVALVAWQAVCVEAPQSAELKSKRLELWAAPLVGPSNKKLGAWARLLKK